MTNQRKQGFLLIAILIFALMIRILPFYFFGEHPLGYDTGFYRRYIINPTVSFPNAPTEILGTSSLGTRIFIDILKFLPLPPDYVLYGGYLLATLLAGVALFFFTRHLFGVTAGAIALFLFAISPVQYTAYWYFLWKNMLGVALLFLIFLLMDASTRLSTGRKSYYALLPALALMVTHTTTSIIFALTLTAFLISKFFLTKYPYKLQFVRVLFTLLFFSLAGFLWTQWPISANYFLNAKALFIGGAEYLRLSAFLFPLAAIGLYNFWPKTDSTSSPQAKQSILLPFALVAAAFPIFQLPFYQRIFPFLDLAIIIFAALGIKFLLAAPLKIWKVLFIIWMLAATGIFTYEQITKLQPLVSDTVIKNLELISNAVPPDANILTDTTLAPWVYGWSRQKIFAPGLINNFYSEKEWDEFWNTADAKEKIEFLKPFLKPLYFFTAKDSLNTFLPSANCAEELTEFIYKYKC
ncbi:MAG: hypothetical protein A3B92_01430 [Candidatus Harrisonbacteria bacterium RIFCSPHIGHO2_02_FULL_42_16]|uniref:Glycosyltransferase RgtA/B/C/D-like domain-containing protein n=1 Tax=Candidatus Harrisonbacteria bacterium RIFCSPHIGHO2_02_FULL_42_16 TaxID=1798404 RepID=A0A1G1ZFU3_9BACT|nr:MAG: hypothetical protein A3B92_01430 [Candidatus Harrisonbacteria bacterium RIFCSPHIGHO2_02_FULL_42_16]